MSRHGLITPCVLVALAFPSLAGGQPKFEGLSNGVRSLKTANAGEIWEQTTEVAGGMGGAPQTSLACIEKGTFAPPKEEDEEGDCKVVDMRRSGNKATWRSVCENGIAGDGEMTWQSDTFTGSTKLRGAGMAMSVQFRGRKLGGGCDPTGSTSETERRKRQNDALKQLTPAQLSRTCDDWAQKLDPLVFVYEECNASRRAYATRLSTREGFLHVARFAQPLANEVFEACGKTRDGALAEICPGTLRGLQPKDGWFAQPRRADDPHRPLPPEIDDGLRFILQWCPEQGRQLAERECAGRQPCTTVSHGEDGDELVCKRDTFARWIYGFCEQRSRALAGSTGASHGGTKNSPTEGGAGAATSGGAGAQTTSFPAGPTDENPKKKPPADEGMNRELIKRGKAIFGF